MKLHLLTSIFICIFSIGAIATSCLSPVPPEPVSPNGQGLIEQLTLDDLAARADFIVIGEITHITCHEEGKGNIYTLITLSVEQTVKGKSEGEMVIRVAGGELDGTNLVVEDAPSFQIGERAVLFLEEREDNNFSVVGGFQGKFSIDENNIVSGNKTLAQFIDQIEAILE